MGENESIEPVAKPTTTDVSAYAVPLRMILIGSLRVLSLGLAAVADLMEKEDK